MRQVIWRKAVRLRALRAQTRSLHNSVSEAPPLTLPLPSLAGHYFDIPRAQSFPLYEPGYASTSQRQPTPAEARNQLKIRLTERMTAGTSEIEEQQLQVFYKYLLLSAGDEVAVQRLALPAPEERKPERQRLGAEKRKGILLELKDRLLAQPEEAQNLASPSTVTVSGSTPGDTGVDGRQLVALLAGLVPPGVSLALGSSVRSRKGKEREVAVAGSFEAGNVPLGLVRKTEWDVLFDELLTAGDATGADALLNVMRAHGVVSDYDYEIDIMSSLANAGRSDDMAKLYGQLDLAKEAKAGVLFIRSLIQSTPPHPRAAIEYLRGYEKLGRPLSQESYNLVLQHLALLTSKVEPTSHSHALAKDLFAHMRLVAHPTPDRELYTTMITACADPRMPEPERARDLWIEMTQEGDRLIPTRDEYTAIIRALSSTKTDYLEGFDMLRQMLARHQDVAAGYPDDHTAVRNSPFVPSMETFESLMRGTMRAGDLDRARWLMHEILRLEMVTQWEVDDTKTINAAIMVPLFLTYATWQPPIERDKIKEPTQMQSSEDHSSETDNVGVMGEKQLAGVEAGDGLTSLSYDGPRTSGEALREASSVFDRILHDADITRQQGVKATGLDQCPFRDVRLTPYLVNAYIAVVIKHGPSLETARAICEDTWKKLASVAPESQPDGWTYLRILEGCQRGIRRDSGSLDRNAALPWANATWLSYREFAKANADLVSTRSETTDLIEPSLGAPSDLPTQLDLKRKERRRLGLGSRQIEVAWRDMIRLQASAGQVQISLYLLEQFAKLYPPQEIIDSYIPLQAHQLAIRMSDVSSLKEPDIPPFLLFRDVEVLHDRLVEEENKSQIRRVGSITGAYKRALETRRKMRLDRVGESSSKSVERLGFPGELGMLGFPDVEPDGAEDEEGKEQPVVMGRRKSWARRKSVEGTGGNTTRAKMSRERMGRGGTSKLPGETGSREGKRQGRPRLAESEN